MAERRDTPGKEGGENCQRNMIYAHSCDGIFRRGVGQMGGSICGHCQGSMPTVVMAFSGEESDKWVAAFVVPAKRPEDYAIDAVGKEIE